MFLHTWITQCEGTEEDHAGDARGKPWVMISNPFLDSGELSQLERSRWMLLLRTSPFRCVLGNWSQAGSFAPLQGSGFVRSFLHR